jgi:Flp pilus assembly protein TadD
VIPRALEPTPSVRSKADLVIGAYRSADYVRAIALAEEIIAAHADDALVWIALARAHANLGDAAAAASACTRGIARHPADAELHVVESALEFQRERFSAAAEAARRALYLDRTLAVAQLALGVALMRAGDAVAADRALRAAERMLSELKPGDAVRAGDGATAAGLAAAARSHRDLLEQRGSRAS